MESEAKYQPLLSEDAVTYEANTSDDKHHGSRLTKSRRFLLFITAALAVVALTFSQRYGLLVHDDQALLPISDNFIGSCVTMDGVPVEASHKNVWRNLDVDEATAIRSWLWSEDRGFNLTKGMAATDFDNSIYLIEAFTPPKAEVLRYMDGTGSVPDRYAKIFIHHGAHEPPTIGQYLLGPLPSPITSLSLASSALTLTPLTHIYHRPDVPYTARLFPSNSTLHSRFMSKLLHPLQNATMELFGGKAAPWDPNNGGVPETGGRIDEPDLLVGMSTPFSYDGEWRRSWMQVKKNVPGSYLKALDMYFYCDQTSSNPDNWHMIKMVYNRQVFKSTDEFLEAFRNGTLKRSTHPDTDNSTSVDTPGDDEWATRQRKGNRRDLDERAGPRLVSFDGPRYKVDKAEGYVSWMGWSFFTGFERDMGLNLWDIRFRGERIIYEITPQEAMAVYSGSDPHQSSTVFLDRGFGMGTNTRDLMPGYDCPTDALYLPASVHGNIGSSVREKAICVFERDIGKPLSRHSGYLKNEMGATRGFELTVRAISTVGNYDYLFDYNFHLDGTLEIRLSASGYLQGAWWDDTEMDYGTKIRNTFMGSLHDHVVNYKVDFDINGTANSLMAVTLENEAVESKWYDDDWGSTVNQQAIRRRILKNEDEGLLNYPPNYEGIYVVLNEDAKNRWGNPRGYGIHPGVSAIHLTNLDSKRTEKNVNFAKQHLGVSRRKETEPSSSSMWNLNLPGDPPVDFFKFFDGESLEKEDLVAWINLGMHHIPRAEDSPQTLTNIATSSVLLTPFNFNDWDPAMESQNAIILNAPEPGKEWTVDEPVRASFCLPPELPPFSYSGMKMFEEDGTPAQPATVKEMRSEAESYHAIFAEHL